MTEESFVDSDVEKDAKSLAGSVASYVWTIPVRITGILEAGIQGGLLAVLFPEEVGAVLKVAGPLLVRAALNAPAHGLGANLGVADT